MKSLKNYISFKNIYFFSMFLYLIGILIGYLTSETNLNGLNNPKIDPNFWAIFLQNLKMSLIFICLSLFTVGISSIVLLLYNGIYLGVALKNISFNWHNLLYLIPHGIIEIPILLLASTIGINLTYNVLSSNSNYRVKKLIKEILIVILGLIIAALIETYITPKFI